MSIENTQKIDPKMSQGEENLKPSYAELQARVAKLEGDIAKFESNMAAMQGNMIAVKEELRLAVVAIRSHQGQISSQGL